MDKISPELRSKNMSRIRSKNTSPEIRVRRALHVMGHRFRLHRRDLPGSPDIVLPRHRTAIFVHGCYWHRHQGCKLTTSPKTNMEFWARKFDRNIQRDKAAQEALTAAGWHVIIVWECDTRDPDRLKDALTKNLAHLTRSQ